MLTLVTAQQALQQHANNTQVAAQDVEALLQNVKGVTFANIAYVTDVKLAAAHKHNVVQKVTVANVQLFNNLQAFTDVYVNAVKRTAAQITSNNAQNIADFEKQDSYFTHTNCYSVVQHKTNNNKYLFAIFNSAQSMYFINAQQATKQQVAALMQPAAAKKLLEDNALVHNVANNITHSVQVRTIALQNIVSITAQKQTITV